MVTVTGAFADEISERTDTYLQQVETTTAHLPDAVDAYGEDAAEHLLSMQSVTH